MILAPLAFIGGLGMGELIVILVIVLIIFGVGKLPEIGSGLGKGIKSFRKAMGDEDGDESIDVTPQKRELNDGAQSGGQSASAGASEKTPAESSDKPA